jgi:hypothetical protein
MNPITAASVAVSVLAVFLGTALPALASTHEFTGRVLHVSTENIKVKNTPSGQTMSFLLLPHFDQVFRFDGKTTYQMKFLHPGKHVAVYYDERALGIRHADRIVVLKR